MKLYLSSYRIPDLKPFTDFVGKEASSIKMGVILNAKDNKGPEEKLVKIKEMSEYFSDLGFQVEGIDLLKYLRGENLLEKFKSFDLVWFGGGNTFSLRWAIQQSNCEEILKKALESGVIYGGDSAGALVVGPTLKYFDVADDPSAPPQAIYEGLGLIDFAVLPHWGSVEFGEILKTIKEKLEKEGFKTMELTDAQYLLIEDGKVLRG